MTKVVNFQWYCNISRNQLYFSSIEKMSLSGTSFREEMFSTSEIELVETTITVTTQSCTTLQGMEKEYTASHLIEPPQCSTRKKF